MSSDDEDSERLDPRIRDKLEELNECTDNINRLEKQFEESNALFRTTLNESTIRLRKIALKLGKCVDEARPYYESKARTSALHNRCQTAAIQYERSCQLHSQAKETITIAEQKFHNKESTNNEFDSAWQEMLNHATIKFMEAETLKKQSENEHSSCMWTYLNEERQLTIMEKQLKSAIKKSKFYFEESAKVQHELNALKSRIDQLSKTILESKKSYSKTLKDLEMISEEIHEKRAQMIVQSLTREPGVGAELKYESDENVPQLRLSSQLCHLQVYPKLSPKSLTLNSFSAPNISNRDCDELDLAFNTNCNINDNSDSGESTECRTDPAFEEIDLK